MVIDTLTTFLGWCSVINIGCLILAFVLWIPLKNSVSRFGASLFGGTEEDLKLIFLNKLMLYRLLLFFFNIVPYVALKLMK
jgi:hypothetical protein